jgi:hypothetical protein
MFGMLDYRAHKLWKLLRLPFRMTLCVAIYAVLGVIVLFIHATHWPLLFQVVAAFLLAEVAWMVLRGIGFLLRVVLSQAFFYVIDVVPAHGSNAEEAQSIVLFGRLAELDIKMRTNIADWAWDDTDALVAQYNWLMRRWFGKRIRRRTNQLVAALKRMQETGQQASFSERKILQIAEQEGCKAPRWEGAMISLPCDFVLTAAPLVLMASMWPATGVGPSQIEGVALVAVSLAAFLVLALVVSGVFLQRWTERTEAAWRERSGQP